MERLAETHAGRHCTFNDLAIFFCLPPSPQLSSPLPYQLPCRLASCLSLHWFSRLWMMMWLSVGPNSIVNQPLFDTLLVSVSMCVFDCLPAKPLPLIQGTWPDRKRRLGHNKRKENSMKERLSPQILQLVGAQKASKDKVSRVASGTLCLIATYAATFCCSLWPVTALTVAARQLQQLSADGRSKRFLNSIDSIE